MKRELFNSYTDAIPPFRYDVEMIPVEQNGESFIYFFDQLGYASPDFAIPYSAQNILSLLDGNRSVNDIQKFTNNGITKEKILDYIRFLDENALLNSPYLKAQAEAIELKYEQSEVHESNTAGISYPKDKKELESFLNEAFEKLETIAPVTSAKALYAPHIDPRVGLDTYIKAFSAIKNLKPKRVVMLATSHYSGYYPEIYEEHPFIISKKNFKMVNGEVENDRKAVDRISAEFGTTFQDRAHRIEHSIELHLLFLNHLWNHDYKIVPILVGGLDELFYLKDGHLGNQVQSFSKHLAELFSDDDTFFLISGDLAHIGRKFGDQHPAKQMFEEVKTFDKKFLSAGANSDKEQMLSLISEKYDPYRICGFPPLFTFINAFSDLNGKVLTYDIWDEEERDSAVSFGSILFE